MIGILSRGSLLAFAATAALLGGCATKESVVRAQSTADAAMSAAQHAQQTADQALSTAQGAQTSVDQLRAEQMQRHRGQKG